MKRRYVVIWVFEAHKESALDAAYATRESMLDPWQIPPACTVIEEGGAVQTIDLDEVDKTWENSHEAPVE